MKTPRLLLASLFAVVISNLSDATEIMPLFSKGIPSIADDQELQLMTVEYAPGESSPAHRHNGYTLVYVLEGTVIMQIAGANAITLQAGQTFFESPTNIHVVSKNASDVTKAKFLVYFVRPAGLPATVAPK